MDGRGNLAAEGLFQLLPPPPPCPERPALQPPQKGTRRVEGVLGSLAAPESPSLIVIGEELKTLVVEGRRDGFGADGKRMKMTVMALSISGTLAGAWSGK